MVPKNMISLDHLLEKNVLPDPLIRAGIRRMLAGKIREETKTNIEEQKAALLAHVEELKQSPIAIETLAPPMSSITRCRPVSSSSSSGRGSNTVPHYGPPGSIRSPPPRRTMLALTCARAELTDGQRILELGCGWGSLSLWMAEKFPMRENHRRLEFRYPETIHRRRSRAPRPRKSHDYHTRYERLRSPRAPSTESSRSRCSST